MPRSARAPQLPVPAAAVVCLSGDRVLLVRRAREPHRGRWSFPGGRIRPGETARAAAARETQEETGLQVRVLDVVDVFDSIFPPFHYVVADYLAVPASPGDPSPRSDALDARWVPFDELRDYGITEAMARVLARARWLLEQRAAPPCLGMEPHPGPGVPAPAGIGAAPAARERIRGLYAITDDDPSSPGHVELARAALRGGARVVQLRDKRRDAGELLPVARAIRVLCAASEALFLVNDRVDLAAAAEADGVHLGQTDLPVREARKLLGPDRLVGVSVENEEQARATEREGADYLGAGAIYGSATKPDAGPPVGPEQIRRLRRVSGLPIVAIGGITAERLPEVRDAGADAFAVISALSRASDPEEAARRLVEAWEL